MHRFCGAAPGCSVPAGAGAEGYRAGPTRPDGRLALVEREADLEGHLVVPDLAGRHVAPDLDHLEPADVADGGRGPGDRVLDRIGDALFRGPDEVDELVDVVGHGFSSL